MEEKKTIKIKLHSILFALLGILLVISIIVAIYFKVNNSKQKNKIEEKAKENMIKIRYAYTYNVPTADILNEMHNEEYNEDYIDILEIYLEGYKLTKINELIKKVSFEKVDFSTDKDTNLVIGVGGNFEVTINNDIILLMDKEWSMYTKDNDSYIIHTPEELFNEIASIVYEKAY